MSSLSPLVDAIKKMSATELHLVPGERIYVIRKGKRRDIGRDPVNPASIDKLVAEVLGAGLLIAARARPQSSRTESEGLVFDMIATPGANGISACLRVVPAAREVNEIDLDMPEPLPSVSTTATGSFARASAPPVLTLESSPFELEISRTSNVPSVPPAALDALLDEMASLSASDLHLAVGAWPAIRVDGQLGFLVDRALTTIEDMRAFVRLLANEGAQRALDERNDVSLVYTSKTAERFRVSLFTDRHGTRAVVRRLATNVSPLESYGLPAELLGALELTRGIVFVTGPSGSGKSTLLASMVDYVNRSRPGHVVTIEDPIEIVHAHERCLVTQRQIGEHARSWIDAVRGAQREDADVVMIGDLREPEAIRVALEMAETGRLVVAGLPVTNATTAVERLAQRFPADAQPEIRGLLASLTRSVVGQVLCRRNGGGQIPALEVVIDGHVVTTFADSLVGLVRHGAVAPEEAWRCAPDRDQIATAFHTAGIPFPS